MTDKKLNPDELAQAVKEMIAANGDCMTELSFETQSGSHEYTPLVEVKMDGSKIAYLAD